jgi:hypothetical protein
MGAAALDHAIVVDLLDRLKPQVLPHDLGRNLDDRRDCSSCTARGSTMRADNLHLKNCDETKFVKLRTERDRSLPIPTLMLSALQVNLAGGRQPAPERDGRHYLKIPLDAFPYAEWDS